MKTTKLTLSTRYFDRKLNIRMKADKAAQLMDNDDPMESISEDLDRIFSGYAGRYLTMAQARKINSFNADRDYFNCIEIAE